MPRPGTAASPATARASSATTGATRSGLPRACGRSASHQKRWLSDHKLREAGVDPDRDAHFLGAPNEFEELFTDEQWATAANQRFPRANGRPWTADDVGGCRRGKFSGAWQHMVGDESGAPVTTPDLAVALASTLRAPDEIPQQLREVFDALIARVR